MSRADSEELQDFTDARLRMVRSQLKRRGICDERVLQAMEEIPREQFVSEACRDAAYEDRALPIECGQTISQPFTVALMCEAARLEPGDRVLEIGTGSGYGAAVLSRICGEVHTVERIPTLSKLASERLTQLGIANVHIHLANGTLGVPDASPFDAIIVTAGAVSLPAPYVDQICDGGRIVIPLGNTPRSQVMYRFTLDGDQLRKESLGDFAFVPLIGDYGWQKDN